MRPNFLHVCYYNTSRSRKPPRDPLSNSTSNDSLHPKTTQVRSRDRSFIPHSKMLPFWIQNEYGLPPLKKRYSPM